MPYPVSVTIEPSITNRNRLTTAFRLILAIPHMILIGGVGIGFAFDDTATKVSSSEGGLLGFVAFILAIVSWFTLLISGTHPPAIRDFTRFYLRWRVRGLSYLMLLEDPYPPFGDGPYPASLEIVDPAGPRDRLTIGFRIFLALPHIFVLLFVLFAWGITAIIAWFAILFTGSYPAGLYDFGAGSLRWLLRVEAYILLMVDEYPPFSLT